MPAAPSPSANWIWHPEPATPNSYYEFILDFADLRPSAEDQLIVSAETSYRLCVDGQPFHWGPLREISPYVYVDRYNLRDLLTNGARRLSLLAHHQGAKSHTYKPAPPALLVGGSVTSASGARVDLSAPSSWRARRITNLRADSHRLGGCVGWAEHVDFSLPRFADWQTPVLVSPHPWSERPHWLERDLPLFPRERLAPVSTSPFGGGWMIDFGVEVFGFVELAFATTRSVVFELHYGEVLDNGVIDPRRHCLVDYRDRFTAPAGEHAWLSYEKRSFRYLFVTEPVELRSIAVIAQNRPLRSVYRETPAWSAREATPKGRRINRILDVSDRTIRINTDDILTDCPWRERAQYADYFYCMETFHHLYGDLSAYRRFLLQYARGADENGALRMCYPSPPGHGVIPDFSLTFPQMLATYGRLSGDWSTVEKLLPNAEVAVFTWQQHEKDHLLVNPPGWVFLDNTSEMVKTPRSAGLNAIWSGSHGVLADLLERFGHAEKAALCRSKRESSRQAWRETFLRDGRLLDADSTPEWESRQYWNYHHQAAINTWDWSATDRRFVLRFNVRAEADTDLEFRFWTTGQVWIDGEPRAFQDKRGKTWGNAWETAQTVPISGGRWHAVTVAVDFYTWDWEFYLASKQPLSVGGATVWEEPLRAPEAPAPTPLGHVRATEVRPWAFGRLSQISVGYAAYYDLLTPDEARHFLKAALPATYDTPWLKRVTPFFSTVTSDRERIQNRVQPCWVPASAFHFVESLVKHGLRTEALAYLGMLYDGMLERGATTWWEEWENRSSNCHAWSAFGAYHFLK